MNPLRGAWRRYWVALRAMLVFTVVLGAAYTLAVTAVAQLALPTAANGSTVSSGGRIVGSVLIGQSFTDAAGRPIPQWFQSRPSAATAPGSTGGTGKRGYDAGASSGSNLAASNPAQQKAVDERTRVIETTDGATPSQIPDDAVTASGSGLDPHISPAYALLQVKRVAEARGLPEEAVRRLVESRIQGRDLGYLGEPTVNVLQLNLALAGLRR
ncbi:MULTISPECIES: potassium-transporting ATPase subunit KdpC [unclassified Leifsonia]|uniref:potassium-transporting ATPase subunit KdpC n=1 Tax=unclassified Leifsonia TaxID=2663824 RepID=UPI0008A78DE4|nr:MULTISPECIES: potassium-transporting ATPase subunit KdpC [unclassified Leifsonia]SEH97393.1 K+-transporting ATPase ATPase C chain [Leifsonia sp. CL154]SFL63100.1 K+-transporting ATPase ATPase C chain [Leifsonia sp. CL147]